MVLVTILNTEVPLLLTASFPSMKVLSLTQVDPFSSASLPMCTRSWQEGPFLAPLAPPWGLAGPEELAAWARFQDGGSHVLLVGKAQGSLLTVHVCRALGMGPALNPVHCCVITSSSHNC